MSTMRTCSAQNAGNRISGLQISKNFRGGMHPDPPSYARSLKMLRSDFWLDPPLLGDNFVSVWKTKHKFASRKASEQGDNGVNDSQTGDPSIKEALFNINEYMGKWQDC